ncbi:MAG: DUF3536 domain-containing protein [Desulfarculus sp.]|nr:MAG: DUF3536 domain-containing protein [Desulfarculus sp.]
MSRYVCIHGHFYQPPRENPWLEVVEVQDSASPYHDWNQRVTAECYAPNAAARRLGGKGTIERIVNNYEKISFDFGPTLLSWLAGGAPEVQQALIQADRLSAARWGQGNALAQVYNHLIMPLANRRDKLTQIRWGLMDFAHRFGRPAQGMWLAETAVDGETLELMAAEGVKFTILAPRQAQAVRPGPDAPWQKITPGEIDVSRPYNVPLPGGGRMAVFFYHRGLAQAVAFENLLNDGGQFARRIKESLPPAENGPSLLSLATDGESYGHHHRYGEMALAYALEQLEQDPSVQLTNYASFLAANPPQVEAQIVENSSWSCVHGVERWRANCGCALQPQRGGQQAWRRPLREGLDRLGDRLAALFEKHGGELLKGPWAARDEYLALILDESPDRRREFLAKHQARELNEEERVRALKLLECQRWGQSMFTSCGWFYDDIAGLEAVQNLRCAARALQLAAELDGANWEEDLVAVLAQARSNQPAEGSGEDIWRRRVVPARVGPRRVAAHAAISGVLGEEPPSHRLFIYNLEASGHHHRSGLGLELSWGALTVTHRRLGDPRRLVYTALHPGGHEFYARVGPQPPDWDPEALDEPLEPLLRLLDLGAIKDILQKRLGGEEYSLADLFLEGRRSLALAVLERTLVREWDRARNLFETHRETMLFLKKISVPLPTVFEALARAVLAGELIQGLAAGVQGPGPERLGELVRTARALELNLVGPRLLRALEEALKAALEGLAQKPGEAALLHQALNILDLAAALEAEPNLWAAQNLYYRLLQRRSNEALDPGLAELGRRLNFAL